MKITKNSKYTFGWLALGFLIPCVGMMIVMAACGRKPFGSTSMLYSDMYHQYYPFFVAFRRNLLNGESLLFSWDVGMGVDYLGMIAYYLGSPLNLLSILVPEGQVLNYFSLLMPLKLGFAGLFFSIFLKEIFRRNDFSISLFASFYALCAWALGYQWNIMWLDTFALLPLVMLGMLRLLQEKKVVLYTVSLFLSVFANYYVGFFTCIFVFLTFFCYEICRFSGWKRFFEDLIRIGIFSVLAIGMTAVLSFTSMAALQTTQSSVNHFPTGFRLNIASRFNFLGLLDGMRQVAGNMGGGLEPTFKEGLPNLYCGVGSILLGILFLLSEDVKTRDKLCCVFLLLFFNVSFLIRQLDYIWHGFHFPNMIPYRFSFLYSFVLLYMAYRAWIGRKKFDWLQILAAGFLTAAILCSSGSLLSKETWTLWKQSFQVPVYLIYNGIALLAYLSVLLWGSIRPKMKEQTEEEFLRTRKIARSCLRGSRYAFWIAAVLEIAATLTAFGFYFPGTHVADYPRGTDAAESMIRYMHEREAHNPFYRAETTHSQTLNDGALNGYNGISAFTSSANVRVTEFMKALGYGAKNTYNRYCYEESSPVSNLFLNIKYMIDREGNDRSSAQFRQIHHFGKVSLYENNFYLPLGFLAEPELADVNFSTGDDSFGFQNSLFQAMTGVPGNVWYVMPREYVDVIGNGTTVDYTSNSGFSSYTDTVGGGTLIYSYVANRDGFACIRLDLPSRNDFYVSVNGVELYRETISLPQMLAVQDIRSGDIIDVRILLKAGENSSATVNLAILDDDLFQLGYTILSGSELELDSFSGTRIAGHIDAKRDGLLYTSIPQNGNWKAYVDGEEAEIVLVGDCMVGLNLTRGYHDIRFEYHNNALRIGLLTSLGCLDIFVLLVLTVYRPKKKQA